ncbi:MAG: flagellar M-ring protein FliF [Epulopiscium sp. Nele67-Bin005]|nr:MAG: flagellar M-ring protein FliF [Epulopiscium sp. Nele67-Bin005]
MPETITQVSSQITERWSNLPKKQKIQVGGGIGALLVAIVLAVAMLSRTDSTILYRNLDLVAAAEVTEVLEANGIAYELTDNGTTIMVDESILNSAKIILARENVPKGNYTFDDAITNSMSTTEQEKDAKMQYLTKVDLEQGLISMGGISDAKIQLIVPEQKNSFLAATQESSASVILTLRNQLSADQIEGIARYLASSVENLKIENITILDSNSNLLYDGSNLDAMSGNSQQDLKTAAEKSLQSKIYALLGPMYDEVTISPNLVLNFDQYHESTEIYSTPVEDSDAGLKATENWATSEAVNMTVGEAPGVDANAGVATTVTVNEVTGESASETRSTTYNNNKVLTSTVKGIGEIDYIASSIAVNVFTYRVYDEALVTPTLADGMTWDDFKTANSQLVALDLDPGVADVVEKGTGLTNVAVYGYEKPIFIDEIPYVIDYKDYIPFVLLLIIGIIILMLVLRFRRQEEIVETVPELQSETLLKATAEEVRESLEVGNEEIEFKEESAIKQQIEKFVDEKPEAVANLLRNWLSDDWEEPS